jgi:trehalose 6-phosphate phosphatase
VRVEAKGLSLTLHYREVPAIGDDVVAWARAAAERTGLDARDARMSVELHPAIAVDKGTALLALAHDVRAACFLGDDAGDLLAFDALDALARGGADVVRIAVRSDEAPEALLERADIAVDGPSGAVALLRELADDG